MEEKLSGNKVFLQKLDSGNRKTYLEVFKVASSFSELYRLSEELWIRMSTPMGTDEDSSERYLIIEKESDTACGYINMEEETGKPAIDIAILPDYRQRGYGFEAAEILCRCLLRREGINAVMWDVMPSNTASRKIAEKLGGVLVNRRETLAELLASKFSVKQSELEYFKVLSFEIRNC